MPDIRRALFGLFQEPELHGGAGTVLIETQLPLGPQIIGPVTRVTSLKSEALSLLSEWARAREDLLHDR